MTRRPDDPIAGGATDYGLKHRPITFQERVNHAWHFIAGKFRKRRRKSFLAAFPPDRFPSVVDIGGYVAHWKDDTRQITVLNLMPQEAPNCKVIIGDGRHTDFPDQSFDLAYSNSVIEHVGQWEDQIALAEELRRIGKAVYCQTPNRWFPIEVHYLTAFFHWYPRLLRKYFIARFLTGWGWLVRPNHQPVEDYANTVKLLTASQMEELFPDCHIEKERFLGWTKSLIAVRHAPTEPRVARVDASQIDRGERL